MGSRRPRNAAESATQPVAARLTDGEVEREDDADIDLTRQRSVVDAFLAASRAGDFDALLALLDPEVVLRADGAGVAVGAWSGVRGAQDVAGRFAGVRGARAALMSGAVGAVWAPGGQPRVAGDGQSTVMFVAGRDAAAANAAGEEVRPGGAAASIEHAAKLLAFARRR